MNGHRFSFGQYKGDLIIDHINFEEIDYIRWCIVNVPYFFLTDEELNKYNQIANFVMHRHVTIRTQNNDYLVYLDDNHLVNEGDVINTDKYSNAKVVNVNLSDLNRIDGVQIIPLKIKEKMDFTPKSDGMFSGLAEKYSSQFIPKKETDVRMSLTGLLCVPQDDQYIGIDQNNDLVGFDRSLTVDIPVYSIEKAISKIAPGDIVKNGRNYSKVIGKNSDNSLKVLSFSGYSHNKKAVKDFMLGQTTARVLINMFNFDEKTGFNPMFFAMASGDKFDVKSLLMLSMTPQGKNMFSNTGGGFNPMMLLMLDQSNSGKDDLMPLLMMSGLMGGQNPFNNMFGQSPTKSSSPETTDVESKVNQLTDNMSKLTDAVASLAQMVNSKNN